jgi:hypothetical protein
MYSHDAPLSRSGLLWQYGSRFQIGWILRADLALAQAWNVLFAWQKEVSLPHCFRTLVRQHPVRYPVLMLLIRLLRCFLRSIVELSALEQLCVQLWTVLPPVLMAVLGFQRARDSLTNNAREYK